MACTLIGVLGLHYTYEECVAHISYLEDRSKSHGRASDLEDPFL